MHIVSWVLIILSMILIVWAQIVRHKYDKEQREVFADLGKQSAQVLALMTYVGHVVDNPQRCTKPEHCACLGLAQYQIREAFLETFGVPELNTQTKEHP